MKYGLLILFLVSTTLHAHGIRLFASYNGDRLTGRAYSGSKGIANVTISLRNVDGTPHSTVTTDADGNFSKAMTTRIPLKLTLTLPDGHRTHYDLNWDAPKDAEVPHTHETPNHGHAEINDRQELAYLRKQVHALQSQRRFRDVLGGIGFVFGLAGILMMVKSRKKS